MPRKRANPPPGIRRRRRRAAAGTARTKPLARRSAGRGSSATRRRENSRCSRARVSAAPPAGESSFFSCADFPRLPRAIRKKKLRRRAPALSSFLYTRARVIKNAPPSFGGGADASLFFFRRRRRPSLAASAVLHGGVAAPRLRAQKIDENLARERARCKSAGARARA